jgi:flavin reductase (DIM6/NTAB) family NADH-FMN oxidoreductase RutF
MSDDINKALEKIPYSVCVVTVGRGGAENGLAVSWLSQVSFKPPMIAISIAKLHFSEEIIRSSRNFVVNLLGDDQAKIAGAFARESVAGESKFKGIAHHASDGGAPILDDALAWFECEARSFLDCGDHTLVIGEVEAAALQRDGAPLTSLAGMRYYQSKPR